MKNAIVKIIFLLFGALCAVGCSRTTIIPDKDLERITREMFLVNAYVNSQTIDTDSLDIYTPILERYGYKQEDFFNTLANFQKRKSARLSDVIEETIASLERLADGYEQKLRNLKFVDSLAKAQCSEEVFWKSRIAARKMGDTTKLQLVIPVRGEGEYLVSYHYYIDSLDKNNRLQSSHEVYNGEGGRTFISRNFLTRGDTLLYKMTIKPKKGDVEYRLTLADYTRREDDPHITFDSIRIVYLPTSEVALAKMDSAMQFRPMLLFNDSIRVRGYLDAYPPMLPHDTVWLRIDSLDRAEVARLRASADSLVLEGENITKRVDKMVARSEDLRTLASRKKYRNDSLRMVAHERYTAQADSLVVVGEELMEEAKSLGEEATHRRLVADSIDLVLWGK